MALAGLVLASCGGGQDVSKTVKDVSPGAAAPSPNASAGTLAKKTAAEMLPDLSDLGYQKSTVEKLPTGGDSARIHYRKLTPPAFEALVDIGVYPSIDAAHSAFVNAVQALPNPPPGSDFPGPNTATARSGPGDEGQAFVTIRPDNNGTLVWSDVYRFGNVFVTAYVLGKDGPDALALRKAIGERIAAAAK